MSGQRKALIVANDEYDQEALRDLLAPAADAEALGRVLGDRQIGEFAVQVVRNEPAHVIEAHIEDLFSESRSDDVLLLHFSGHGLKSESGELFFAASNTRPGRLGSTAVSADFVQRCMRASRSRSVVLLLDCCYGGAFAQGVKMRASGDVHVLDSFPHETRSGGGRGRAVITASSAMEFAFEGDRLGDDQHRRPSVFTSALVEGLATGDADRDEDGWVSLNELYDYVFDKVQEQNPHQTPSRQVELEGDLYLARSRRRRIRPSPIPPDLQAALTDPNMYTRLGAISELQSRLTSDNLPTAVGAYEALAELARTDIRYVADPAAAALSQAALHPEETALHFGQQRQGSAPPHRTIRLLGPPIARACTPRASDDWIHVDETAEGFDISLDTANTGVLLGTLGLKGPTGEAVIAIDVELLPSKLQTPLPPRNEPTGQRLAATGGTGQPKEQVRQQPQQAADSGQAKPPAPPRLELSATMVDFGQLSLHSDSPEHRVQFGNAGGGSLNARAATQADWLKLRRDGDELLVGVDTSATGEHEGVVTVDSDGGSATIRVQARVVAPHVPTKENADTDRGNIPVEAARESATSTSAPASALPAANTADVKGTPEDRDHASLGRPPRTQPVDSATQETGTPPDGDRAPVRQPRRASARAWILGGASVAVVLIVVLIIVLANAHETPSPAGATPPTTPPAGANTPTPSPTLPFREDFSSTANTWVTVGTGASARYSNGKYQLYLKPTKNAYAFATPSVPDLSPAPSSLIIEVSARPISGAAQVAYGVACRSSSSSLLDYEFGINKGYAQITKFTNNKAKLLAEKAITAVQTNGGNHLRAACTSAGGQNAVHLVFWVNGKKLCDVTDRSNPHASGTVGLVMERLAGQRYVGTKSAAVEFDNFVVTQI